jgi:hypothetical protein
VPRCGGEIDTLMVHLGMSMEAFPTVEIENENMSFIPPKNFLYQDKSSKFT